MNSINANRFDLKACLEWIELGQYGYICLYFLSQFHCISSEIVLLLQKSKPDLRFVTVISSSSGPETIATRGRDQTNPDAVIYFGAHCLCTTRYSVKLPTLFVSLEKDVSELSYISDCLQPFSEVTGKILITTDFTNCSLLVSNFIKALPFEKSANIEAAKLVNVFPENWHFLPSIQPLFCRDTSSETSLYPFKFSHNLSEYELVVFIGECKTLEFIINCRKVIMIDSIRRICTELDGAKEFRKRVSLIEKFKSQASNLIGVVFLHFSQPILPTMNEAKILLKRIKKFAYFLTLNQTDYELRLGNFGQLEGFVLVLPCTCNYDIATSLSKYLYPVIFWKELLIVSGQQVTYGGIEWNNEVSLEENEEEEKSSQEDNMQLVQRDLFQKPHTWYGLVVDPGSNQLTEVKQGQQGIASSYINEQELF